MRKLNAIIAGLVSALALFAVLSIPTPVASQAVSLLFGSNAGNIIPIAVNSAGAMSVSGNLCSVVAAGSSITPVTSAAAATTQTLWTWTPTSATVMKNNGDTLIFDLWGNKTNNADTITVLMNVGATGSKLVATSTTWATATATAEWHFQLWLTRITNTSTEARSYVSYGAGDGSLTVEREKYVGAASLTDNWTTGIVIEMQTTQVSASADTTFRGSQARYCPIQ